MEKETLWLPDGYGKNTVIFDKKGEPYIAKENLKSGANIWRIEKIERIVADEMIKSGCDVLKSEVK